MLGINRSYQRYVEEQLCKYTDVAAEIKSSLQYGGVPGVLGMCLASLAVVGIAGVPSMYTKSVQSPIITLLSPRKQATHGCRLLEALAALLFELSVQVYFHMPDVSAGQNRDINTACWWNV